jgi:hypothetical protein
MKQAIALSILFLAQASAKISFGPCVIPALLTYNDYVRELNGN